MRSKYPFLLTQKRLRRKQAAQRSLVGRASRAGFYFSLFFSLGIAAVILLSGLFYVKLTADLPSLEMFPLLLNAQDGLLLQPTQIYDRSGQHLLLSLDNPGVPRNYLSVEPGKPDHFSPQLVQAAIQLMDPTFWSNPGILWKNLLSPQPNTFAERLVDELLLYQDHSPAAPKSAGIQHALRMRLLAAQSTAQFGRFQILEWYLNSANFGHQAYGADTAARLYLDKSASELNLAETALLLAALESPALNPLDAPSAAMENQRSILNRLLKSGAVTEKEYQLALQTPVILRPAPEEQPQISAAFNRLVIDQLSTRFQRQRLERGGVRIITTLDYDLQLQLACAVRTQLQRLEGSSDEIFLPEGQACTAARLLPTLATAGRVYSGLRSSAMITNPQTGQILAYLGETTTAAGEGAALSGYQPGSLLTPFVALTSFASGLGPASSIWDIPENVPEGQKTYQNPDEKFHGPQRLRSVLANDYLLAAAQLLEQNGASTTWKQAETLGLPPLYKESRPSALLFEGGQVNLLQIAQAYGTFAGMGTQHGQPVSGSDTTNAVQPYTVLLAEDYASHVWLDQTVPLTRSVISQQLAYLIHHIFSDAEARRASLGYPNLLEIGRPGAAKIGQIASGQQVWTVGYTPQRLLVTWVGSSDLSRLDPKMASSLWHALMQYTVRDTPPESWAAAPGISTINICDPSGMLPTLDCPNIVSEVFIQGNEPTAYDSLYRSFEVNRETGLLATAFTPLELVEDRVYLNLPAFARDWGRSAGIAAAPTNYDAVQAPPVVSGASISEPTLSAFVREKVIIQGSASGENFSAYRLQVGEGLNPKTWVQIGKDNPAPVENGILGSWDTRTQPDGVYVLRLVVQHTDQSILTAVTQVTIDNSAPHVQVILPGEKQVFPSGSNISFQIETSDASGIQKVVWLVDENQIGETSQFPYRISWDSSAGSHTFKVRVSDMAGNVSESSPVSFTVLP